MPHDGTWGANVWAEALTETFNFKVDHKISESQPYTDGDVTFTFTKSNNPLFFNSDDPSLRLYGGATMTISVPEGGEISSIALTYYRNKTSNKVTANVGSYSPNEGTSYKTSTWTGTASSVKFKVGGTSGHIRLQTVEVTYSLSKKTKTILSFGSNDQNTIVVNSGEEESFVAPTASVKAGESSLVNPVITYKSENSAVADVASDGTITFGSEYGTTKITANYAGDDTYAASTSYYIINYKKTLDASVIFYESFDKNDGTGGNDGQWKDNIATNTLKLDNTEWTCVYGNGAQKCAKFGGSSNKKGVATTPSIDLSAGDAVLAFKAGAWNTRSEMTSIIVSVDNGKLAYNGKVASEQTITLKKGEFSDYTMTISGGTSATKITFSAIQKSSNRFFLDEVMVSKVAVAEPTYTVQALKFIAKDGADYYATFSNDKVVFMPYDVTPMTVVVDATGMISENDLICTNATIGAESVKGYYIPAKTGVLLWTDKTSVEYYTVDNYAVDALAADANMLMPAPVAGGEFTAESGYKYYKLAYNDYKAQTGLGFYWGAENGGAFKVKAGTAYLAVPAGNTTAKGFAFNGEATGIEGVNANVENAKAIYNLNGQRVASMAKPGLYIVNGKKVVRK